MNEVPVQLKLVKTNKGNRHYHLVAAIGEQGEGPIIASQNIDLFTDHLETAIQTAIIMLRSMYCVHLDITIRALLETAA